MVPTTAVDVFELLQVPPEVASVNVIVEPLHTDDGPLMAAILLLVTVTVNKARALPHELVTM